MILAFFSSLRFYFNSSKYALFAFSKVSDVLAFGAGVMREITTIISVASKKPGIMEYISGSSNKVVKSFQKYTINDPVSIPAIAPKPFIRFQNNESKTIGPNAEPKPAHASFTNPNTWLLGS